MNRFFRYSRRDSHSPTRHRLAGAIRISQGNSAKIRMGWACHLEVKRVPKVLDRMPCNSGEVRAQVVGLKVRPTKCEPHRKTKEVDERLNKSQASVVPVVLS
jgi:hypothetical protein